MRAVYDEIKGYSVNGDNPFFSSRFERDQAFVDEFTCIGEGESGEGGRGWGSVGGGRGGRVGEKVQGGGGIGWGGGGGEKEEGE